jgi:hypothetical protein
LATPPTDGRYNQPAAPTPQSNLAADAWANFAPAPNRDTASAAPDRNSQPVQNPGLSKTFDQPAAPLPAQPMATIGTAPPAGNQRPSTQQPTGMPNGEELPWKPLLAVSLALAASLGANFFLGVSYADARHRYVSLVTKTTHAFQKEAGIAA